MCGICGKLNFDRDEPIEQPLLERMMEVVRHRGPDGAGSYRVGPIGLGHRRLSIIDLTTGDQPLCNEDRTVWVVYNGEIYNFPELRTALEARGHTFRSTSDTEVIVHLYEELGTRCVTQLRGMFAFALWDERNRLLLLARDRVGVKPLYYANTGTALVFGSEIKSILCDPGVARRVDPLALDRFITYYYLPGDETLLAGIRKLPPGHSLTVRDGRVAVEQYWDLRFDDPPAATRFDDSVRALQTLLSDTVRDHMLSDVPVGVLLSGGVDSTGILSYAVHHAAAPLHTFTIGFAGEGFADERSYARLAASRYGTVHRDISLDARAFRDFLPAYVWHMEEPVCEPPAVALYHVSRLARESSVKVLLSGEGGDEAFGGYQTYRTLLLFERLKRALGPTKALLRPALHTLSRLGWSRGLAYSRLVDRSLPDYYLSRTATPETFFHRVKNILYRVELSDALDGRVTDGATRALLARVDGRPLLDRMLYVDTKTWLPDDLLVKADKMTMATSVELRVPLLDFRVLEFAASLPPDFKVRGWSTKRLLKAALRSSVPHEILTRKKTGFPVPYVRWLRTDLKEFVRDTVATTALTTYFRRQALDDIVGRFYRDGVGAKEVFCLVVLALWHERFLGAARAAA